MNMNMHAQTKTLPATYVHTVKEKNATYSMILHIYIPFTVYSYNNMLFL